MQALTRTRKLNHDSDRYGRRQPRPMARRTGTRAAIVRAALMEG